MHHLPWARIECTSFLVLNKTPEALGPNPQFSLEAGRSGDLSAAPASSSPCLLGQHFWALLELTTEACRHCQLLLASLQPLPDPQNQSLP